MFSWGHERPKFTLRYSEAELAFYRDIPSHEKIPIPGIKNPPDIPKVNNPKKIPNQGDFATIPGIKIPNPGNKNPESKKNPESRGFSKNLGDFQKISVIFRKSRKNPDGQKTVKVPFFNVFQIFVKNFKTIWDPEKIPTRSQQLCSEVAF